MESRARYHYVDLLRGLAALAVVICHYRWFYAQGVADWRGDVDLPLYSLLWPIYENGGLAVRLFWALSGFVFVVAYGQHSKNLSARTFWVHRFSRLYPLHLLTLLVVAALQILSLRLYGQWTIEPNNDLPHFLLQLAFASNWFTIDPSFNGPIWSVSIEVLIYFVFLLYLKRLGLHLGAAIGLAVAGGALAIITDNLVAQCLCLFFVGVVIAIVAPEIRRLLPLAAAGVIATLLLGVVLYWLGKAYLNYALAAYVGCPAILTLFVALDREIRPLRANWHWIGLSTYSTYLWHLPLIMALKIVWGDWIPAFLPNPLVLCLWVAVVAVIGVVSYRHFEAPMQDRLRRTLRSRPRSSQALG
jgi:peptidoglycan/LPS O-acetylase OafA/YrhL